MDHFCHSQGCVDDVLHGLGVVTAAHSKDLVAADVRSFINQSRERGIIHILGQSKSGMSHSLHARFSNHTFLSLAMLVRGRGPEDCESVVRVTTSDFLAHWTCTRAVLRAYFPAESSQAGKLESSARSNGTKNLQRPRKARFGLKLHNCSSWHSTRHPKQ